MKIHEYQGKAILKEFGVPIPRGIVARTPEEAEAAARELGISSSSLSQQIAALETRMGVRLFNRSTRSVVLSAAGEQFVASVGPALEAIRSAVEHVDEHRAEATGTLRINTSVGATRMILTPLILEYMRRNPQMSVEIVTEGALVDVNAKGFDAGIRTRNARMTMQ